MVFSKSWCPYCAKAKRILGAYQLKGFKVLELDQGQDEDAIQDVLKEMTGARSVPRVFIKGKCIGGGDDTERLERDGKLKQLLTEAGAL
jgi:glutaredoxin 3